MKTKIYYVMDTMCGWCYGFSDVITKIEEKYKEDYDFEILPGGMWTYDNVKTMNKSLGEYIKGHNSRIEELTGKKFGQNFNENILGNSDIFLDSLPGAKALVLIQKLNKDITFKFLKKIQEAFFVHGKNVNQIETYTEIAESFGMSKEIFEKEYLSKELEQDTIKYFSMVNSIGALSFPTVIAVNGDKAKIIAQGYSTFNELDRAISSI
ncbi:putative protein-disulfide isomerase [Clostridium cavendishii DSM 21758]|uniref:DSBA-like thioredoxin domain-containing protein n=1 Tax=Clostridium cavendishii DSM 21758 TaxID=1121302 RepID=A0A1M6NEH7_9CLOT|nr:DsbA family protein [Clostridium cavendishii]SHJ94125.1 putative protein-disulfide isomerase [Clostridium cavendishii DSM 21758]